MLTGPGTRQALEVEQRKREHRTQAMFTKLAKHYKCTRRPVNLVGMCATVAQALNATRVPRLRGAEELEELVDR